MYKWNVCEMYMYTEFQGGSVFFMKYIEAYT